MLSNLPNAIFTKKEQTHESIVLVGIRTHTFCFKNLLCQNFCLQSLVGRHSVGPKTKHTLYPWPTLWRHYWWRHMLAGSSIEQLLSAASFFQFTSVCEACVTVLKQRLSPGTSIAIMRFAARQVGHVICLFKCWKMWKLRELSVIMYVKIRRSAKT